MVHVLQLPFQTGALTGCRRQGIGVVSGARGVRHGTGMEASSDRAFRFTPKSNTYRTNKRRGREKRLPGAVFAAGGAMLEQDENEPSEAPIGMGGHGIWPACIRWHGMFVEWRGQHPSFHYPRHPTTYSGCFLRMLSGSYTSPIMGGVPRLSKVAQFWAPVLANITRTP